MADGKSLIHHLISIAIRSIAVEAIWEGLHLRCWNREQLLSLESKLNKLQPRRELTTALRVEAIATDQVLDLMGSKPQLLVEMADQGGDANLGSWLIAPWVDHNRANSLLHFHHGLIAPLKSQASYTEVGAIAN